MLYKIFDFECPSCQQVLENVMVDEKESVKCSSCAQHMVRQIPNPRGYVKDTQTPTKC